MLLAEDEGSMRNMLGKLEEYLDRKEFLMQEKQR